AQLRSLGIDEALLAEGYELSSDEAAAPLGFRMATSVGASLDTAILGELLQDAIRSQGLPELGIPSASDATVGFDVTYQPRIRMRLRSTVTSNGMISFTSGLSTSASTSSQGALAEVVFEPADIIESISLPAGSPNGESLSIELAPGVE